MSSGYALLTDNDYTHFVSADIFRPEEVLNSELVRKHIDLTQPVGLLHVGTLHHYTKDNGRDLMREYIDALPSGSFVAISHFFDPETPEHSALARKMEDVFVHSPMGSGMFRTRAQLMPGLELISPGPNKPADWELSDMWWPDGPKLRPLNQVEQCSAAAVGRKP